MTRQQNSISAFSPDGVSLTVGIFSRSGLNYWAHNPKVSSPNSDQTILILNFELPAIFSGETSSGYKIKYA